MPARSDKTFTVLNSHNSVEDNGVSMTRAPVDHFAIGLLINKEKNAPVKPTTNENAISVPICKPFAVRYRLTPNSDNMVDMTSITARLVAKNKKIRFMSIPLK